MPTIKNNLTSQIDFMGPDGKFTFIPSGNSRVVPKATWARYKDRVDTKAAIERGDYELVEDKPVSRTEEAKTEADASTPATADPQDSEAEPKPPSVPTDGIVGRPARRRGRG